jgi:hypothetical protein
MRTHGPVGEPNKYRGMYGNTQRTRKEVISMCQPQVAYRSSGVAGCTCGCCGCGCSPAFRQFFSSQEELECLVTYKNQLQKELAGVDERIKERKDK